MSERSVVAIIPVASNDAALTVSFHSLPVLAWTLRRLRMSPRIGRIVLAIDGGSEAAVVAALHDAHDNPAAATTTSTGTAFAMGPDRISALRAALEIAGPTDDVLLCPPDRAAGAATMIDALLLQSDGSAAVDAFGATRSIRSTLKRVVDGRVETTVSRDAWHSDTGLWLFRHGALERALAGAEAAGRSVGGGADLARGGGLRVRLIDTGTSDLPVRTAADARFAERWLAISRDGTAR